MISTEKESREQVKLARTKSREAADENLVKIEDMSVPLTESRATGFELTPLVKNGKGLFCLKIITDPA